MLTEFDKEAFWRTVEATMVEIFGVDAREAFLSVNKLRSEVILHYQNRKPEMFYNQEAFDVAANLAKLSDDNLQSHWEEYLSIKRRYQFDEKDISKLLELLGSLRINNVALIELMDSLRNFDLALHPNWLTSVELSGEKEKP